MSACIRFGAGQVKSNIKTLALTIARYIRNKSSGSRSESVSANDFQTISIAAKHIDGQLIQGQTFEASRNRPARGSAETSETDLVHPATMNEWNETIPWVLPDTSLLSCSPESPHSSTIFADTGLLVRDTLANHGIPVDVTNIEEGPRTISLGIVPGWVGKLGKANPQSSPDNACKSNRVKVQSILSRKDDLTLALGTPNVRLQAPVPGKAWVGLEIPRERSSEVYLGDILAASCSDEAVKGKHLPLALGIDSHNTPIVFDLADLPHVLIGGKTGSGKSACLNSMICSLIMHKTPYELQLLMLDPKRVEFAPYADLPHLMSPVVVEPADAVETLEQLIEEMLKRLKVMQAAGSRNIQVYNERAKNRMPYIVTFVDELADLIASDGGKAENDILKIAQLGRAAGIHLVLATQRPSVDVVPGTIKANMATRIAFSMSSAIDSRVILDCTGAETLLGRGDMFLRSAESQDLIRVQGAMVPDDDIDRLLKHWSLQLHPLLHAEEALAEESPIPSALRK